MSKPLGKKILKKVGKVNVSFHVDAGEIKYFDGAEGELLKLFRSKNPDTEIKKILSDNPSWPMIYHLSSKRGSLLEWYEFKPGANILEIGAGCGAITETLLKKNVNVTALEIDPMRAMVNATRNKNSSNLEIIVENLQDYSPHKKFDYIVCIGVLEYSGKYISSDDPYGSFLSYMRNLLQDQGKLILAIENKLGLKYLAGAPEDHTGILFDSINNYPNSKGFKTFSRNELRTLLSSNGFQYSYFFYPHPDYKLPHCVFSDELHPGHGLKFPLGLLPTTTPEKRIHIFSEQAFAMSLETERLYPYFANSFLVEACSVNNFSDQNLAYFGQVDRKDSMSIATNFVKEKGNIIVKKQALNPTANKHLENMEKNSKELGNYAKRFTVHPVTIIYKNINQKKFAEVSYPFIEGETLERKLLDELHTGNVKDAIQIISTIISIVKEFNKKKIKPSSQIGFNEIFGNYYNQPCECIYPGIIDINLDNFILSEDSLHLIDYEWVFPFYVPSDYVLGRVILSFFRDRFSDILRRNYESLDLVEPFPNMVIPREIFELPDIKTIDFSLCLQTDLAFQAYVGKFASKINANDLTLTTNDAPSVEAYLSFFDHAFAQETQVELLQKDLQSTIATKNQEIQRLINENNAIPIRGYKKIRRNIKKLRPNK